ncbi:MAG: hypothetical protein JSV89_01645 [Spirochaetaceae bacterium]|nr:MAG: hypothetical protein JSV89_01645 [Spirochaetaceae bacterium]
MVSLLMQPWGICAEDVRIFEHPGNWAHPQQLRLTEADLLFNDPFTKLFGSRAFHFLGRLDNGTQYVINVFRWQYAFLGGWGMSVLIVQRDGSTYICEEKIPDREVTVAEDRFSIRIGNSSFEGADGRYRVRIQQEEFACELLVRSLLPLWQPGDGYVFLTEGGDVYMRLGVHCPWAVTSGYMVIRDNWMSAAGQCYGDRSRHSYSISRMSSPTLAFRGFTEAQIPPEERWFLSVLQYTAHPGYGSKRIPVLILAHGGRWVFTTKDYELETADFHSPERSSLAFPHRYNLRASCSGYRLEGQFVVTDLYHLTDIFTRLPGVFRPVVSLFFKRPVIFRTVGYFQGVVTHPDGSLERLYLPGQCEYSIVD